MTVFFKHYNFTPPWWATLLTLIFIILFILLGRWQLQRFAEKKNLKDDYESRSHSAALTLTQAQQKTDARYYSIIFSGHYINQFQFLLDNQMQGQHIGYHLLTLFLPDHSDRTLLINRGWIALGVDRQHLPTIPPVFDHLTLTARIIAPPTRIYTLGNIVDNPKHWPARLEALDLATIAQLSQHKLYPFIALLNPDQPYGYWRHWQPTNIDPYRSLNYAYQWFAFAITLFIIYIALNIKSRDNDCATTPD